MPERTRRRRIGAAIRDFLTTEAAGGAALLAAAIAALLWANLSAHSYESFWSAKSHWDIGAIELPHELRGWVTEGLMAVFFFVVGVEIKREIVSGELQGRHKASLPVAAAIGGMLVPALIYLAINPSGTAARGWGIPMATDIAFAIGLVTLLGDRVTHQMKVLLLGIAIADDIGAVIVIALFYSAGIDLGYVAAVVVLAAGLRGITRIGNPALRQLLFGAGCIATWLMMVPSGIHASMAGIVAAGVLPERSTEGGEAEQLERTLHRVSSFAILPLFALASAGVVLSSSLDSLSSDLGIGVIAGLVVGKPLGIWLAAAIALRLGIARAPSGIRRRDVLALGSVAGVGFTVSLFVAGLAFPDPAQAEAARLAVLVASLIAAVVGVTIFRLTPRGRRA
ncbi:MAG TPA: Na+/H+ antiporter NhaA [Actinomycetota bacterium]|nr:Na+/H+ antiporter NhaA [Actinomycetota bacterium]